MPRTRKSARLWLRPEKRSRQGRLLRRAAWVILDGGRHIATGCFASKASDAEKQLASYIAEKYRPKRRERDIDEIKVADVLLIYFEDRRGHQASPAKFDERIARLNEFWGEATLSEVTGESCRAYVAERGSVGGARRDLEDLRAAINHHAKQGFHRGVVAVTLPPRGAPRDRWLTRNEAARLIWSC